MQSTDIFRHGNLNQLIAIKIPISRGRGSENNMAILEQIALMGPLLKYDIFKNLKSVEYSTISRRVDDLAERGYIGVAGKRLTGRGKQKEESTYGLRWKGFVASLSNKKVKKDIIAVLRRNPILGLPEKDTILSVIEEITTKDELENISQAILEAYLDVIPPIETIREDQLWVYLLAVRDVSKLQGFKLSQMPENMLELLDRPAILAIVKERIAPFIEQTANQFTFLSLIFTTLNELMKFITGIDPKTKPSVEVQKYLKMHSLVALPNVN
jgi:hypothetical protein